MTTRTTIANLKTTVSADGGFDEVLTQVRLAATDCWMEGRRVVKVVLPDGIVFAGPSGSLTRPDGFDATDLCDLARLANQIELEREERIESRVMSRLMPEFADG